MSVFLVWFVFIFVVVLRVFFLGFYWLLVVFLWGFSVRFWFVLWGFFVSLSFGFQALPRYLPGAELVLQPRSLQDPVGVINKESSSELTETNWKAASWEIRAGGDTLFVPGLSNRNKHLEQKAA